LPDLGVVLPGVEDADRRAGVREGELMYSSSSCATNSSSSALFRLLRLTADGPLTGEEFRARAVAGPGPAAALVDLVLARDEDEGSKAYLASLSAKAFDAGLSMVPR